MHVCVWHWSLKCITVSSVCHSCRSACATVEKAIEMKYKKQQRYMSVVKPIHICITCEYNRNVISYWSIQHMKKRRFCCGVLSEPIERLFQFDSLLQMHLLLSAFPSHVHMCIWRESVSTLAFFLLVTKLWCVFIQSKWGEISYRRSTMIAIQSKCINNSMSAKKQQNGNKTDDFKLLCCHSTANAQATR